jgi:hypothetical protein
MVPLSRARVATIYALPEFPGHPNQPGRPGNRPRRGLPVAAQSAVVPVAGSHLRLGQAVRLRPWAAALVAAIAPFLHSAPGIGYEQHAYLRIGYGVWTQLWGCWALPFAWVLSWRAAADNRFLAPAAGAVALTAAFHYETGYLAFMAILIMPFLVLKGLRARLMRGVILLAVSLLAGTCR